MGYLYLFLTLCILRLPVLRRYRAETDSSEEWQTLRVVPNDSASMTIYRLWPRRTYQFLVMARDRFGRQRFSPTASATTLRTSTFSFSFSFSLFRSGHIRIQSQIITDIGTALSFIFFNTPRNLTNKKRLSNCKIAFNISKLLSKSSLST